MIAKLFLRQLTKNIDAIKKNGLDTNAILYNRTTNNADKGKKTRIFSVELNAG